MLGFFFGVFCLFVSSFARVCLFVCVFLCWLVDLFVCLFVWLVDGHFYR